MPTSQSFIDQTQWYKYRNDSGEEVPAHAVILLTEYDLEEGCFVADQSDVEPQLFGAQFNHYISQPQKVRNGDYGVCTRGPALALYDTLPTAALDCFGPRNDEFGLFPNVGGFKYMGGENTTAKVAIAIAQPLLDLTVQLTAALAAASTANANPAYFDASGSKTVHTGITITVKEGLGTTDDIPNGSYCHCHFDQTYKGFVVDSVECQ